MSEKISKAYCDLLLTLKEAEKNLLLDGKKFELAFIKLMSILTIAQIIIVICVILLCIK